MANINISALESINELNEQEAGGVIGGRSGRNNDNSGGRNRRFDLDLDVDVDVDRSRRTRISRRDTFRGVEATVANTSIVQGGAVFGSNNDGRNRA